MSGIQKEQWKQRGMVSILVTMLLMIVISLIVLGFAQISRRNQRQTTDRQLSTQAFYAAESGINEASNLIKAAREAGSPIPPKPDCTGGSGAAAAFYASLSPNLDAASNVAYTCLMVNPSPSELVYDDIPTTSTVVPIVSSTGANISSIRFDIISKDDTNANPSAGCPTNANTLPTTATWTSSNCGFGVFRFDLVPTNGGMDMTNLQDRTMTSFLVPIRNGSGGTSSIGYPAASPQSRTNTNNRVAMACTNTTCTMNITALNANQYYLRASSIYKNVRLVVTARDAANAQLPLAGAQAVIDSTGKAQDVLRRIQVRVPLTATSRNLVSDYAIQTTDSICKRFASMDGYFQSYAASSVSGLTSITVPPNPLCQ